MLFRSRLDWVRIEPARILDAGCGGGDGQALLHQRYPQASWLGVDSSRAMLEWARAKFDGGSFGNSCGNSLGEVRRRARWQVAFSAGLQRLRAWLQRRPDTRNRLLCADIGALPLQSSSVGLVWSNLALPWVHDLAVGQTYYRLAEQQQTIIVYRFAQFHRPVHALVIAAHAVAARLEEGISVAPALLRLIHRNVHI